MHKIIINSTEELVNLGSEFAKELFPGSIILLNGQLGSGKTTFTKGIAKGLEIKKNITSPTFNIIKEYDEKLCHIDAYRVLNEDIGLDHYLESKYIVCIEWSENIIDFIPYINYIINIEYTVDGRIVTIEKRR
ncbi:MAG: tRNA (adenosine(37)-N6)-threonylcarbamoyltransferase complex ATPase subunit type 1 TsaE [Mycoplasmatales bacterium]